MDDAAGMEAGFEAAGEEAAGWVEVSDAKRIRINGFFGARIILCWGDGRDGGRKRVEDCWREWMWVVGKREGRSLRVWRAQRRWRVGVVAIMRWSVVCVSWGCLSFLTLRFESRRLGVWGMLEGV